MASRGLGALVEAGSGTLLRLRCPRSCLHLADSVEAGRARADPGTGVCSLSRPVEQIPLTWKRGHPILLPRSRKRLKLSGDFLRCASWVSHSTSPGTERCPRWRRGREAPNLSKLWSLNLFSGFHRRNCFPAVESQPARPFASVVHPTT